PFIINFFWSIKHGEKVNDNPWEATTLEWTAPSPPPHGNFVTTPVAYRGPYEYSLPGRERDFTMQNEPVEPAERTRRTPPAELVHASTACVLLNHGNAAHNLQSPTYRSLECDDRDLAVSCVGSNALWRTLLRLHFFAHRCAARYVAARIAQRPGRHNEHRDPDHVVGDGRAGVGIAEDAKVSRLLVVHAGHHLLRRDLLGRKTRL